MPEQDIIIATFKLHDEAEPAVRALQESGFGLGGLSIVGRNFHTVDTVVGYYTCGREVRPYGSVGPIWNELLACFSDSALSWVPDLGLLVIAGNLMSRVLQAAEDHAFIYGLTTLGVALQAMGVPEHSILGCEDAIRHNHFVLIVQGQVGDVRRAQEALALSEAESIEIHHLSMPATV
jgi:hypothetical protein